MSKVGKDRKQLILGPSARNILEGFIYNFKSPHTRLSYARDVEQFLRYLMIVEGKIDLARVDHHRMVFYRNFLIKEGGKNLKPLSKSSVNCKMAAVSRFFTHLVREGLVKNNPCQYVERYKIPLGLKTKYIDLDGIRRMFNVDDCADGLVYYLHRAVVMFLFSTGLRQGEVRNLKFKDVTRLKDRIHVHYQAKGEKEGVKVLRTDAAEALEEYIEQCQTYRYKYRDQILKYSFGEDDYLFRPTKLGNSREKNLNRPLGRQTIINMFKKYARLAEIEEEVSPHSARASMARELNRAGKSTVDIQRFLNHSSINMTSVYIGDDEGAATITEDLDI